MVRMTKKKYYMSRYIVTFISAGLVAVIPLVFNLMVVMCFLPWGTPVRATGLYPVVTGNVFENVFYYNEVKDDIQNNLEAQLAGTMYTPDTSQIRERLNANIEDYARKNNIEIGTQQQTAIDGFLTQIEDNYKSSLGLHLLTIMFP